MESDLEDLLRKIEKGRDWHLKLSKAMLEADGRKIFPLDFLAAAVINRSLSNCEAFTQLVRAQNYLAAASPVRLQLDSFMRFYASFLVEDPHQFATSVLGGTEVRKMKDRSGAFMTDRHLVESAAAEYSWAPSVYKSTSGFIHLSNKHIFSAIQAVQDDGSFSMHIGSDPSRFPNTLWVEMAEGFIAATEALFRYLEGWVFTKENPHLAQAAREQANDC